MPVIPFVSPKGGCGKSTSAVLLASELSESGHSVTIIDADPNRPVARWSKRPGKPKNLSVLENVTEETIIKTIDRVRAGIGIRNRRSRRYCLADGRLCDQPGRIWS